MLESMLLGYFGFFAGMDLYPGPTINGGIILRADVTSYAAGPIKISGLRAGDLLREGLIKLGSFSGPITLKPDSDPYSA